MYTLLRSENEDIRRLVNKIINEQSRCPHKFGDEWQEYNFYKKRCKTCGFVSEKEY